MTIEPVRFASTLPSFKIKIVHFASQLPSFGITRFRFKITFSTIECVRFATVSKKTPLSKLSFLFFPISLFRYNYYFSHRFLQ